MGVLLDLRIAEALSGGASHADARLAIASCGNAALAAAVLARAAERALDVFVPEWAEASVVAQLRALGARVETCTRQPGIAGDPCYHRFQAAVRDGAVPFCCQGPDNGLTIEGGSTLAWELLDALGERLVDRVFVQVGGGALASACAQGFADAVALGRIPRPPRLHAVQTVGGHPLQRAYDRVLRRVLARLGAAEETLAGVSPPDDAVRSERLADLVREQAAPALLAEELRWAASHRSQCMWPWETEPRSLATGILDDETYDWLAIVAAMLATGGYPLVVDEATIADAHGLGRATTGVDVDPTGTAGLAGLLRAKAAGVRFGDERLAVLFTGARRG
jgi:threonine dehydratase